MPKYQHDKITALSIDGKSYEADDKGVFELPEGEATDEAVRTFGLTGVKAESKKPEGK